MRRRSTGFRVCISVVTMCLLAAVSATVSSEEQLPGTAPPDEVTDSLDAELLEGLDPPAPLDQPDGDDLGASENPLIRLIGRMKEVESWIRAARLGATTQKAQQDIVAELDKLIAEQQKKCNSGGAQNNSSNQSSDNGNQPGDAQQQASAQAGNQPATDSTDDLTGNAAAPTTLAEPQDLLKRVWGHLPERMRDQMLQFSEERFLPKYEAEIEAYFLELIERESSNMPRGQTP